MGQSEANAKGEEGRINCIPMKRSLLHAWVLSLAAGIGVLAGDCVLAGAGHCMLAGAVLGGCSSRACRRIRVLFAAPVQSHDLHITLPGPPPLAAERTVNCSHRGPRSRMLLAACGKGREALKIR